MKAEELIVDAIKCAQNRGIKIIRGSAFNWCDPKDYFNRLDIPCECNVIGAVLLKLGKENLLGTPGWLKDVCEYLGEKYFWMWRFNLGFDCGLQLTLTVLEDDKEKEIKDKVSTLGIKIAKQFGLSNK